MFTVRPVNCNEGNILLKIVDNNDRPLPGFYAELHTYLLTAYIYLATITPWALVYIYIYIYLLSYSPVASAMPASPAV